MVSISIWLIRYIGPSCTTRKYILNLPNSTRNASYIMELLASSFNRTPILALAMAAGRDHVYVQCIDTYSHHISSLAFVLAVILH